MSIHPWICPLDEADPQCGGSATDSANERLLTPHVSRDPITAGTRAATPPENRNPAITSRNRHLKPDKGPGWIQGWDTGRDP